MSSIPQFEPGLGNPLPPRSGAEPQIGGPAQVDIDLLDFFSRGLWSSVEELRKVARTVPAAMRPRYSAALLARLELVNPAHLIKEVHPWRGGRDQRVRIIDSLGLLGDVAAVPALERLLDDANAEVRQAAMFALGRLGYPEGVAALGRVLRQPERTLYDHAAAIDALAMINNAERLAHLVAAMQSSPNSLIQRRAVQALAATRDEAALPFLIDVLRDMPDAALRAEAARALGRLGAFRAVLYLFEALEDEAPDVRLACVQALMGFSGTLASAGLSFALSDADEGVRTAAHLALQAAVAARRKHAPTRRAQRQ